MERILNFRSASFCCSSSGEILHVYIFLKNKCHHLRKTNKKSLDGRVSTLKGATLSGNPFFSALTCKGLRMSHVAHGHQTSFYPSFCDMKQLGVLPPSPGGDASQVQGPPPALSLAVPIYYTWVERGTVRVKCLVQEHNTVSPARA